MGRKTHPTANRLGYNKDWLANWYADKKQFPVFLKQDIALRTTLTTYLKKQAKNHIVSKVTIERNPRSIIISIRTSRMNQLIGKGGEIVQKIEKELQLALNKTGNADKRNVKVNILEVPVPETDADLVAKHIAREIELRKSPKHVMGRTAKDAIRMGAEGIKIKIAGRIRGSEMTRHEKLQEGTINTQTFRALVDYATAVAQTKYGVIGVKVWILKKKFHRKNTLSADGGSK
ncbi:MAG: 30S ribosomal protein S3 [Cytophagales bacterium]